MSDHFSSFTATLLGGTPTAPLAEAVIATISRIHRFSLVCQKEEYIDSDDAWQTLKACVRELRAVLAAQCPELLATLDECLDENLGREDWVRDDHEDEDLFRGDG